MKTIMIAINNILIAISNNGGSLSWPHLKRLKRLKRRNRHPYKGLTINNRLIAINQLIT